MVLDLMLLVDDWFFYNGLQVQEAAWWVRKFWRWRMAEFRRAAMRLWATSMSR